MLLLTEVYFYCNYWPANLQTNELVIEEKKFNTFNNSSNNSCPPIIPAGKKGKKLIIPAGIIRGNTVLTLVR